MDTDNFEVVVNMLFIRDLRFYDILGGFIGFW